MVNQRLALFLHSVLPICGHEHLFQLRLLFLMWERVGCSARETGLFDLLQGLHMLKLILLKPLIV